MVTDLRLLGLSYCLGTLTAALLAVASLDRLTSVEQRTDVEDLEGDL